MPKHLPDPAGKPDAAATHIINKIHDYVRLRSRADPKAAATGLRHIFATAEDAWDESLSRARDAEVYWSELVEATHVPMGTLQGRVRRWRDSHPGQEENGPPDHVT